MRRSSVGITAAMAVAVLTQAAVAATPQGPPFSFGGVGPHGAYAVTIRSDGSVQATGDGGLTRVGVPQLAPSQLASLGRSVTAAHFGTLPAQTRCFDATRLSTTWIRIATRKVTVAGSCLAAYQRLLKAFVSATHFFAST